MSHKRNQSPERLRRKRVETGWTQAELARRAKVSPSHLSAVESGSLGASPKLLGRLADALGCEIADLMPPENEAMRSAA
jgi:transcriptional regulator with XRE-family HTH domain